MFLLDMQSKVPVYEQIQKQIIRFIEAGVLQPGDRLPSVRQLAQDNGINPNTVSRAYTELEKKGIVNNLPKKGVYVSNQEIPTQLEHIKLIMRELKDEGCTYEDVKRALEEVYGEGDVC